VQQDRNGTITNFQYGPPPTDLDAYSVGQYIQNNTLGPEREMGPERQLAGELRCRPVGIAPEPPRRDEPVRVDIGYGPYLAGQTLPAAMFAKSGGINTSNFSPGFGNNSQLTPIFQYNPWTVYNYLVGWARGMSPSGR
jgi:hypothetical protein